MKFSDPSSFNDPFDCCPTQFSGSPEGAFPHEVADTMNQSLQIAMGAMHGIVCLTPHADNMLMWSHYGDQHKSICVGFDANLLIEQVPVNDLGNSCYEEPLRVEYSGVRPNEYDRALYTTKSIDWEYEQEYRLISASKNGDPCWGPGVWNIPTQAIKEIVFGARIDSDIKRRVRSKFERLAPQASIKQAILHSHRFEIVIESIESQTHVGDMAGFVMNANGKWVPINNTKT